MDLHHAGRRTDGQRNKAIFGKHAMIGHVYRNKSYFYAERDGLSSREVDFGAWWYSTAPDDRRLYAPCRVSWVADTGDVYTYNHWTGEIELLATIKEEAEIEWLLRGWVEMCGQPGSLGWIRGRLSEQ